MSSKKPSSSKLSSLFQKDKDAEKTPLDPSESKTGGAKEGIENKGGKYLTMRI